MPGRPRLMRRTVPRVSLGQLCGAGFTRDIDHEHSKFAAWGNDSLAQVARAPRWLHPSSDHHHATCSSAHFGQQLNGSSHDEPCGTNKETDAVVAVTYRGETGVGG